MSQLHDDLHLSADQEPAWRDYTAAVSATSQAQSRHQATQTMLPQLTTPRRIALIEATMAADDADFHRQGQAVTHFYELLTPNQQRTFDSDTLQSPNGPPRAGNGAGSGRPLRTPPQSQ